MSRNIVVVNIEDWEYTISSQKGVKQVVSSKKNMETANCLCYGAIIEELGTCSGPYNTKTSNIQKYMEEENIIENMVEKGYHNNSEIYTQDTQLFENCHYDGKVLG